MARDTGDLAADLGVIDTPELPIQPSWNIAPTATVPILVQHAQTHRETATAPAAADPDKTHRALHAARWGLLPPWAKDIRFSAKTFNARSETAAEKPSFRRAVASQRCAIPAEAYYEWLSQKNSKTPHLISPPSGELFLFAGLYEWWKNPAPSTDRNLWTLSCTILTGPSPTPAPGAHQQLGDLHHRMPLILTPERVSEWISPTPVSRHQAENLLQQLREDTHDHARSWKIHPVSKEVGNTRVDGPHLIEVDIQDPSTLAIDQPTLPRT